MKRVLLIEDHGAFSDALIEVLDGEPDLQVVGCAASMAEVRALEGSDGFDVVLLDLRLPDGDGTELIGELRVTNPHAAVLVLTIAPEHAKHVGAEEMGAEKVISKDATLAEIIDSIKQAGDGQEPPLK